MNWAGKDGRERGKEREREEVYEEMTARVKMRAISSGSV